MANSADPDQMPQNAASDQGPHCLQSVQSFFLLEYLNLIARSTPKIEIEPFQYIVWGVHSSNNGL